MFQRQLLRSSRAASQALKQTSRSQNISSSQFPSLSSRTTRPSQPITSQYFPRRWQSTEPQKTEDKPATEASNGNATSQPPAAEDAAKQELEKKNKEILDLKDKYLRSVADYRNLQDRMTREQTNARQFGIQKFAADLLDSVDNLDRALSAVPPDALSPKAANTSPNADLLNLHSGLRMTEEIMLGTLKKHGLERFDPMEREGGRFDPNSDEATFYAKQDGKSDGEVFYTQSRGYTLNGRVIRAAKVGVVKNT